MPSLRSGIGASLGLLWLERRQGAAAGEGCHRIRPSGVPSNMTPSKPMRTMLPPNLTRNHYEVKRLVAEGEGRELPHWYQLTDEQKQAEELEVGLFRRAILRAEEEQDLVSNFSASLAEQPPAAAPPVDETGSEATPCDCRRCTVRATFSKLLKEAYEPFGMTVSEPVSGPLGPFEVNVVPLDTRRWGVPLTAEEVERLQRATDDAFGKLTLITAGIDFAVLTGPAPQEPITFEPKSRNANARDAVEAVVRQWEAAGRPLRMVFPTQPGKVTPGISLDSPPIDEAAFTFSLRQRERLERMHANKVRRAFPPKV